MKFVFWQNILSIHQSAFLNALSTEHDVVLVVEKESQKERAEAGWNMPIMNCQKIIISPTEDVINSILEESKDRIHVISGLEVTFEQFHLTRKLCYNNFKVICYLEPYNWLGIKGLLRDLKYSYLKVKYGKFISAMLPTGELGVTQYRGLGFKNIFEWGYFTESDISQDFFNDKTNSVPKLLFVGSLDKRKNIMNLIKTMTRPEFQDSELTIIGNGPLKDIVIECTKNLKNICFLGTIPNDKIRRAMARYDILVLPSLFDGWGAVVNEALSAGLRVICSDHCGACTLLRQTWRGAVFCMDNSNDIELKLINQISLGPQSPEKRLRIMNWYSSHLSGEVAKDYFISICHFIFDDSKNKPQAPWRKE